MGKGGDDVLPVKGNRKDLRDEIETAFTETVFPLAEWHEPPQSGHGRIDRRHIRGSARMRKSWPTIRFIARLERRRDHVRGGRVTRTERETIYLITSLPGATPKRIMSVNPGHWRIEAMHRDKDVTPGEDRPYQSPRSRPAKHLHADKRHTYCAQAHQQPAHKGYRGVSDQQNNGDPLPGQRPQQFLLNRLADKLHHLDGRDLM